MPVNGDSVSELVLRLEGDTLPLSQLPQIFRDNDAPVVHAGLLRLARAFENGLREPAELSALLPSDVSGFCAESQELLAALAVDGLTVLPPALSSEAPTRVQLGWMRARLIREPQRFEEWRESPLLDAALHDLPVERVVVSGLLAELCARGRREALGYLRCALKKALLLPEHAERSLLTLIGRANEATLIGALELLTEPWLEGTPSAPVRLRDLPAAWRESDAVLRALCGLYRARRAVDLIRQLLRDHAVEDVAISALGECGDENDLETILATMEADVELLGAQGLSALLALKQRGMSPAPEQATRLVALYVAAPHLSAADAGQALDSRVEAVLAALESIPEARSEPARVVALLAALGTRAARHRLIELLSSEEQRATWPYALEAIGRMGLRSAETNVLRVLDAEPEAALDCLLQIGDQACLLALEKRILGPNPPFWSRRAARVLLALSPSAALVRRLYEADLLDRAGIDAISAVSEVARCAEIEQIADIPGHPLRVDAIRLLARSGGPLTLRLLGRWLTDSDAAIREAAQRAIEQLGARLFSSNSARPACLRSAPASDPADAALADTLLARLAETRFDAEPLGWLREMLSVPHPELVPVVRPYLRHENPEIRKRTVRCLAAGGPRAATWLLPWLSDDDATVVRQVLIALGELHAGFAGEAITRLLDHSNMNLKKTAASALAEAPSRGAVKKLLFWLGTHDNSGFRELLEQALRAALGDYYSVVVLGAAERAEAPRTRELLLSALTPPLGAAEVASIIAAHPKSDLSALGAGLLLDGELRRRGLSRLIRASSPLLDRQESQRLLSERNTAELRRLLGTLPESRAEFVMALRGASTAGQLAPFTLALREAHQLLALYPELDAAEQHGVLALLAHAPAHPTLTVRIAELLKEQPPERVPQRLALRSVARCTPEQARFWLHSPITELRAAAVSILLASGHAEPLDWPAVAMNELVRALVSANRHAEYRDFLCADPNRLRVALLSLRDSQGPSAALALWHESSSESNDAMLLELLPQLTPRPEAEWYRFAQSSAHSPAARATAKRLLLSSRRIGHQRSLLRELLQDSSADTREHAALLVCQHGSQADLEDLVSRTIAGEFRESFAPPLRRFEPRRDLSARERERMVQLLARCVGAFRIPALVEAWLDPDVDVSDAARSALRAMDVHEVLPFVASRLVPGNPSALDVLGASAMLKRELFESFARDEGDWPAVLAFLERATASSDGLFAPDLFELLLERANTANATQSLRIALRLTDFHDPARLAALASALEPLLTLCGRSRGLEALNRASAHHPPATRLRLFSALAKPGDEHLLRALSDQLAQRPNDRRWLSPDLTIAVEERLRRDALEGAVESARAALSYFAAHAPNDKLVELLDAAVRHRAAPVRLKAHRLLRMHADRERYLRATRTLLADADTTILRSAIRTLCFGRDVEAAPAIVEALFHSSQVVRASAREGLLMLGENARGALLFALNHARPDRRAPIAAVLAELPEA